MRTVLFPVAGITLLAISAAGTASAGVLYDYSCGGTGCANAFNAIAFNFGSKFVGSPAGPWSLTNSFAGSSGTTLNGIDFWAWLYPGGDALQSFSYSIGTTAFGTDLASTTPVVSFSTAPPLGAGPFGDGLSYTVEKVSFAIAPIQIATAGMYWLTLSGGVDSNSYDGPYWDDSGGPSTAFQMNTSTGAQFPLAGCGVGPGGSGSCSESFDVTGAAPEPGSLILIAGGLLLAAMMRRGIAG